MVVFFWWLIQQLLQDQGSDHHRTMQPIFCKENITQITPIFESAADFFFLFAKLITINVLLNFVFLMVRFILRTSLSSYLFYTLILSLLFHQDFTTEQYNVTPRDGWKAYYAATRAVIIVNSEFYNIIRERSLPSMSRFWLNADYVKCVHSSGELFSGYCLYLINKTPMFTSIEFYIAGFPIPALNLHILT